MIGSAHPRSRGENASSSRMYQKLAGSSPLTRGKPLKNLNASLGRRLIPAHAGKTVDRRQCLPAVRAHPRSRGENKRVLRHITGSQGSSPLTRGKHLNPSLPCRLTRLIPAHAGKTLRARGWLASRKAHPRSRGENARKAHQTQPCNGSSPLTRGKRSRYSHSSGLPRLIPAHAGKTFCVTSRGSSLWAHPRSRGENNPTRCILAH